MYYCNVINEQILTAPRPLPPDVSPETAIENGWIPVVFLNMPHQVDHNTVTQLIEMKTQLKENYIECWHEAKNKTDDQIQATKQLLLSILREDRNKKLLFSDWTQLPTAPIIEEKKVEWESYRQSLRDFPSVVNLENIQWPVPPE